MNSIIFSLFVVIFAALTFVPALAAHNELLRGLCLGAGLLALFTALQSKLPCCRNDPTSSEDATPEEAEAPSPTAPPPVTAAKTQPDYADAVQLLGLLQQKGRLIDFLMEDVTTVGDAQMGAAARVVHQGCKKALQDHIQIVPIASVPENSTLTLEKGYSASEYRLVGKVSGEPPFSGKLLHKGWKVASIQLPHSTRESSDLPPIAPAEVELKSS